MAAIEDYPIHFPEEALDDLKRRLELVRWPEKETVGDWSQGVPLDRMKAVVDHWRTGYDWRRCEAELDRWGNYRTEIKGLPIHFMHIRSPEPNALPLLMTHGWPGSVLEFMKVIGPLTDPVAHGGKAEDAFHLILPSLPGYGFSAKPEGSGWGVRRTASAWIELMQRLGYDRYVAQGGDWGAAVTTALAYMKPAGLEAIHLNMVIAFPPDASDQSEWTEAEKGAWETYRDILTTGMGYANEQGTKPQTIGYSLNDSPVGQCAWIYEKFHGWTDCDGDPENILSRDEILDNITLYWLTGTGASSARMYWESTATAFLPVQIEVPTGGSVFPKEILRASRRWAEKNYVNIIHWNELDKGGHFAAFEQPAAFVDEIRACFRGIERK
jgi:epoxide hydrolase